MRYDVAVVGLGAMGAASLAHLARRGARVAGIERFGRGHDRGASSGESRIVRKAYFENPAYVPLLERAYELWDELEAQTQRRLVDFIGILMVGTPDRATIAGTLATARQYGLPLDVYDATQIAHHFPGTQPHADEIGLLEHQAGFVRPEAAVAAHLDVAEAHGAATFFERRVAAWTSRDGAHRIAFDDGETLDAARLVVTAGMWSSQLLGGAGLPLRVQRNVQVWFVPSTPQFECGIFPTFFLERAELPAPLYGFPAMDGALKAALHKYGVDADPERVDRRINDADVIAVRDALEPWMPGATHGYARGKVCTYTLTPDGNFIIDRHPSDPSVIVACGFSGHGFKFCPVVGEILADLALDGGTRFDIGFLSAGRFSSPANP